MARENFSSGAIWENVVGYSRVVKVGNIIEVAGTTAASADSIVGEDDLYEQCMYILEKISKQCNEIIGYIFYPALVTRKNIFQLQNTSKI